MFPSEENNFLLSKGIGLVIEKDFFKRNGFITLQKMINTLAQHKYLMELKEKKRER